MNLEEFKTAVLKLGIELNDEMLFKLNLFYELLVEWNQKINLTRIVNKEEVYLKHFYDSLTLIKSYDLTKEISLCDVGTGAGFPGIVLKIVFPNLKITLVDSLLKRINYLKDIINKLELSDIEAIHMRGEDFARIHREEFDIVTARAVSSLKVISEICLPMVKVNGYFIPMKANVTEEIVDSKLILKELNSELEELYEFKLPKEDSNRTLVKIIKKNKTNSKYPRSIDKMKK